jgi:Tfp pilus assembly protein PilP
MIHYKNKRSVHSRFTVVIWRIGTRYGGKARPEIPRIVTGALKYPLNLSNKGTIKSNEEVRAIIREANYSEQVNRHRDRGAITFHLPRCGLMA